MSNDTIQVSYDELSALARQFAQIADRAQGVQKALKSQVELVQAKGWQSPAATRFFDELADDILPAFDRFYKAMAETQTTIQLIAKDFKEAEQNSESLIKEGENGTSGGTGSTGGTQTSGGDTASSSYTVKPGDTLWDIAQKHGVTVDELVAANNIANRDLIHPGDQITIPGQSGGNTGGGGGAPVPPIGTIGSSGRSGGDLNAKLDSFNVESNGRYAKGRDNNPNTNDTYCNLYASDVAQSLGAPLPIYIKNNQGGTHWMGATDMKSWLDGTLNVPNASYQNGPQSGWVKMDHTQAAQAANNGHVVVVAGHGHMAVVRAGTPAGAGKGDVIISQAGAHNFNAGPLKNGWGQWTNEAEFYVYKP